MKINSEILGRFGFWSYICNVFIKFRMNGDHTKRIPPQGDSREIEVGGLLAAASDFARGVFESVQTLAGTTFCKGI